MSIHRELRIACRIPCEIIRGRSRSEATIVDVSARGLGVETGVSADEGDSVCIVLYPHRRPGSIEVRGIIWNERKSMDARRHGSRQVLGLMLSDPSRAYLALLDKLAPANHESRRTPTPQQKTPSRGVASSLRPTEKPNHETLKIVYEAPVDSALPRPKFPLPPSKANADDALPLFQVRIKQVDGPRTRRLEVRAKSEQDVPVRLRHAVEGEWEILELRCASAADPAKKR